MILYHFFSQYRSILLQLLISTFFIQASPYKSQIIIENANVSGISIDNNYISQLFISNLFPRVDKELYAVIPVWQITNSNSSCVHRFFDSSPLSPNNRYLAITCVESEAINLEGNFAADILLFDLLLGTKRKIASTRLWDTQLGCQLQWGSDDEFIFYNNLIEIDGKDVPVGIKHSILSNKQQPLPCLIYHVSSNGKYAACARLDKIKFTQQGYGIYLPGAKPNINTHGRFDNTSDGIYLTDIQLLKCKILVTLSELLYIAKLPLNLPTYGFHVKFSSDSKLLMIVIRTMEPIKQVIKKIIRRQHLFTLSIENPHNIKYIISWSSIKYQSTTSHINGQPYFRDKYKHIDANHPNWIPNSHMISINIQLHQLQRCKWDLYIIDIDNESIRRVFNCSSGHPTFHQDNRYIILDAYAKESYWFKNTINSDDSYVPLRIIDIGVLSTQESSTSMMISTKSRTLLQVRLFLILNVN